MTSRHANIKELSIEVTDRKIPLAFGQMARQSPRIDRFGP